VKCYTKMKCKRQNDTRNDKKRMGAGEIENDFIYKVSTRRVGAAQILYIRNNIKNVPT